MRNEQALVVCAFGWGKEFRLYRETLYVANTTYRLAELTGVQLLKRQALGVPSARLELQFGRKTVVLRGIAAVEEASKAAEYLATWCEDRSAEYATDVADASSEPLSLLLLPQTTPTPAFRQQNRQFVEIPSAFKHRKERECFTEVQRGNKPERKTERISHQEARGAREALPIINVPIRLAEGEHAYFSAKATHCGERLSESLRSTYPAQDHGLLILTDRRMLYIGRKSQMVLEYQHLMHLSRLIGALAFEADHWQKRAIFTLSHPEACATCLEAILQKTSLASVPGVPGVPGVKAERQASEVYVR